MKDSEQGLPVVLFIWQLSHRCVFQLIRGDNLQNSKMRPSEWKLFGNSFLRFWLCYCILQFRFEISLEFWFWALLGVRGFNLTFLSDKSTRERLRDINQGNTNRELNRFTSCHKRKPNLTLLPFATVVAFLVSILFLCELRSQRPMPTMCVLLCFVFCFF